MKITWSPYAKLHFTILKTYQGFGLVWQRKCVNSWYMLFISSKLDFNNGILVNLPAKHIQRLQSVQNYAARLVMQARKYDHITPILQKLHWLPVHARIQFKILVMTYKCQNNAGPKYLSDLLVPYENHWNLRSNHKNLLTVPRVKLQMAFRSFAVAAPTLTLWNKLPLDVRQSKSIDIFKSKLKTFLYADLFLK